MPEGAAAVPDSDRVKGVVAGIVDTLVWAATALYWPLLKPAGDAEILGHRLVWACLLLFAVLAAAGRLGTLRVLLRQRRRALLLVGASAMITLNWAGFTWGINHGHVVEASLGFFINPLVTVVLAVLVLRESVRPWTWVAIGLALVAVVVVTADYGRLPWYALAMAATGGLYGMFKKQAGAGALESLALETLVVAPIALGFLVVQAGAGRSTWLDRGADHALLLVGGGLVTITPLLFFGYAASRVPLVTLGLIGYLAPIITFALGILYFDEHLPGPQWAGYVLIWIGLAVFAVDSLRASRGRTSSPVPVVTEEGIAA